MMPRMRNAAIGPVLALTMVVISGCCSADRQVRADVRLWMKDPPPVGSAEYKAKFKGLLAQYGTRLVPAALSEAASATSLEERQQLFMLVQFAGRPSVDVYRACLSAVRGSNRFRCVLAKIALGRCAFIYKGKVVSVADMARDFEALTRSERAATREFGYYLLCDLAPNDESVARLLFRAANEDRSFAVRMSAAFLLCHMKGAEPDVVRCCLGVLETVEKQNRPYITPHIASSLDDLMKRLARILRSDRDQQVEGTVRVPFQLLHDENPIDLKVYALMVASALDLQELGPEVEALVKSPDPIVRNEAEYALRVFEWKRKNR